MQVDPPGSNRETRLSWELLKWRMIRASCTDTVHTYSIIVAGMGLLLFQGIPHYYRVPPRQLGSVSSICVGLVWPSRVLRLGCPKVLTRRNLTGVNEKFSRGPEPLGHDTMSAVGSKQWERGNETMIQSDLLGGSSQHLRLAVQLSGIRSPLCYAVSRPILTGRVAYRAPQIT